MDILSTIFQQRSRRIGLMIPDVVVSERHSDALEVTEHPVERPTSAGTGFIADHAYRRPSEVVMEIGFAGGGSLLDFYDTAGIGLSTPLNNMGPKEVYAELLKMQQERQLLDVTTGKRLYTNMVIRSLDVTTERTSENVLMATVTLREIITSQTQTVSVAAKENMKEGVNTSAVQNSGVKTPTPKDESLLSRFVGFISEVKWLFQKSSVTRKPAILHICGRSKSANGCHLACCFLVSGYHGQYRGRPDKGDPAYHRRQPVGAVSLSRAWLFALCQLRRPGK